MKRILLFALVLGFALGTFAQQNRAIAPKQLRNKAVPDVRATEGTMNQSNQVIPGNNKNALFTPEEEDMGNTWYDLQSNTSMQNRIHFYDDGTIGGTFTFGLVPTAYTDRGTGYNYYDGSAWGPAPTARIEDDRTGWPAYAPWGENGEIIVAHWSEAATDGLMFSSRTEKGTGEWQPLPYFGPVGYEGLLWPRMTTGGVDNSVIHLIPLTRPVGNGGAIYEGIDGALLYSRSSDGGATWDPENVLLDEINADYFKAISGDTYEIQARGDVVAFTIGDSWTDFVLMKSTDGGDSWEKTVIWENPYPLFDPAAPFATDTFYCIDGSKHLSIDMNGTVHVAFGINRAISDGATLSWFPLVDGLGYWKEGRPTFSNDVHSLNPYLENNSELVEDYSLIGWAQDINNNGTWDILGEVGLYYVSPSGQPTIYVDDNNQVFVVWAGLTETFNNGLQDYRHLWGRSSPNGGEWWGGFVDLTGDLVHIFDECVFPNMAQNSDDYVYLNYQRDTEPGLSIRGDLDPAGDNNITFMKISKAEFPVGITEKPTIRDIDVAQNQPNPFSGTSSVYVNLLKAANLSMDVTNMMGQVVYTVDAGRATAGLNKMDIDGSQLSSGVYFYTVKAGESVVTKKMIVE
ncbi:MAG: T9SS type A sorting domain-containing protein [Bacteroidales bacterium]|nr:T9SS type A sorting domain-containing protein [Bacteroidales bacterium]MCF8403217.1 T9SS type A sorting domain-containing protein [Bacteroidales bacterium]